MLFVTGLCLLFYILGAAIIYFQWPGSKTLLESFEGGRAWHLEMRKPPVVSDNFELWRVQNMNIFFAKHKVKWNKEKALEGYTLMSSNLSTQVILVDMEGNAVHHWNVPFRKAWPNPTHTNRIRVNSMVEGIQLMPNGDILAQYYGIGDTPYGYGLARIDKDSNIVWTFDENMHHDVFNDPGSGNIYALSQHFIKDPVPGFEHLHYPIMVDEVVILSQEGKELKRISLFDAFSGTAFEELVRRNIQPVWDQFHSNSVMPLSSQAAPNYPGLKAGDILVSVRNLSILVVIDPDKGKVVKVYRGPWRKQHSARFLDNGHLLMFDNLGIATSDRRASRALEYDPQTGKTAWEYDGGDNPIFSITQGKVQRLPNGNTLVAASDNALVREVTPDKEMAWEYVLPQKNNRPRSANIRSAVRYPRDYVTFVKSGRWR